MKINVTDNNSFMLELGPCVNIAADASKPPGVDVSSESTKNLKGTDSSFLEIVQQDNGEFILKRMDEEKALVTIQFSEEVSEFLSEHQVDVAKAMIGAGVQTASAKSRAAYEAKKEEELPSTIH